MLRRDFRVKLSPGGSRGALDAFVEHRPHKPLVPVPMADNEFGIELELSTSADISRGDVANLIKSKASVVVKDMTGLSTAAVNSYKDFWRLVDDNSIACSISTPNCNTFELVSRVLKGGSGLGEVDRVLHALGKILSININKSMGFHVHVNIETLSLSELKKYVRISSSMEKPWMGLCRSPAVKTTFASPTGPLSVVRLPPTE